MKNDDIDYSPADEMAHIWDDQNLGDSGVFKSSLDPDTPAFALPKGQAMFALFIKNKKHLRCFLSLVLQGTSLKDASGSMGIPVTLLNGWLSAGHKNFHEGKDTYKARLYYDVLRAKSQARAQAQMKAKMIKPVEWLISDSSGSGWAGEEPQPERLLDAPIVDAVDKIEGKPTLEDVEETFSQLAKLGAIPDEKDFIADALQQEQLLDEEAAAERKKKQAVDGKGKK